MITLGGGGGLLLTPVPSDYVWSAGTGITINAAGESGFAIGRCQLSSGPGTSKVISAGGGGILYFATGSITFANAGSTVRFGINDVTATGVEDGTHDVFADFVGGTDPITANSVIAVPMESGTKTIADGDLIAVGAEMTARGGADQVILQGWVGPSTNVCLPYATNDTGAGPVKQVQSIPHVTIRFDDGTYGWVGMDRYAYQVVTSVAFNSGSTPDEYALLFQVPFGCRLRGVTMALASIGATDDFEVILYSDPTGTPSALATLVVDADLVGIASNQLWHFGQFSSAVSLAANTDYGLALRPTTANSIQFRYLDFVTAALRTAAWFGTTWRQGTRTDQSGGFSETAAIVPAFGLWISTLTDGAALPDGSGSAPVAYPFVG